ncbi:chemotaxis protein CheW [Rhodospirillaceae bacterium SYSU D60014]|uniref:chemotaxis protein CheW n=1 Tax=Virgifigura deserti TaxID=2268457 RepID=UPI000E669350
MDDLLSEFLTETAESLAVLDVELVKLEQNPNDPALLGNIFRLVHTIKGTCGFLGLPRLEAVAHAGENVLGKVRDGELEVTPEAVSLILECLDRVRSLMGTLEQTEAEPAGEDSALINRLNALADGVGAAEPAATSAPPAASSLYDRVGGLAAIDAIVEVFYGSVVADEQLKGYVADINLDILQAGQRAFLGGLIGGPASEREAAQASAHRGFVTAAMEPQDVAAVDEYLRAALAALEVPADAAETVMGLIAASRPDAAGSAVQAEAPSTSSPTIDMPATAEAPGEAPEREREAAKPAASTAGKPGEAEEGTKDSAVANQSIRVNVDLLENLMTMVSELVLTRNQVLQILRTQKDSEFAAPLQRLNHVTSELQEGVMKTRMQPIGNAWAKLPRLVRDLAHDLGKKIDLQMIGADTELDRQVLEMIKDPLTHMVRNSADHGLETPEERRRRKKPDTGKITLNAYHEGGHIIIEISDDGRGLALEKIKAKALQNGIATQAELDDFTVQQVQQLVFRPGFSTADKVTSVSGRGVGMDVVKTNIEKIGGTIELRSTEGRGSTFVIKIPLTLAIVSALIVECAGERFAIPQISVVELVRISANSDNSVERIKDTPVLRLRNRLLPLVSLREMLHIGEGDDAEDSFIVVTQVGTHSFGMIVDRVFDTEEIVVKPVAPILRHIEIFSGNTILGDGSVIMILDPNGIAISSGQMNLAEAVVADVATHRDHRGEERVPLLLFRAGDGAPKAVPLALVARLEEIDLATVERSNGVCVVQYRGQLMPLISISADHQIGETGKQPILVFSDRDRSMGLAVDAILDIVEDRLAVELSTDEPGRIGSAIIAGHATDIIDAGYYLTQAFRDWFGTAEGDGGDGKRVLLIDDSPFFRNLLAPLLSVAGYDVTTAESAAKALMLHEAGEDFDVIISDIEMPGMNGFEFAQTVKKGTRWQNTPMVALSSHSSPRDIDRGRAVGFNDYVAKFDRDALLQTLSESLMDVRGAA